MTSSPAIIESRQTSTAVAAGSPLRLFDGVICFGGEDWWYHNRGHYDMQMMRELSRVVPVLYINSVGMRLPRVGEGRMFVKRVARKLLSLRRGLVRINDRFTVASPFSIPGSRARQIARPLLSSQVRRYARRLDIRRPLLWIACPPASDAIDQIPHVGLVYQRTDRYEAFRHVDPQQISAYDRDLKQRADLTLFCSSHLFEAEAGHCRRARMIDHGVDFDRFAEAGRRAEPPPDVADIPHPRVGFIGGIDAHTFDPKLLNDVIARLPDVQFILVGACSLPDGWCNAPNIHMLGQRDYVDVPAYMASCDVLIMPWNQSEWIRACNPVKLKEYLAVGKPIVSTPFDELRRYDGFVTIARSAPEFADAIVQALIETDGTEAANVERRRRRVQEETWQAKGREALEALRQVGLAPLDPQGAKS